MAAPLSVLDVPQALIDWIKQADHRVHFFSADSRGLQARYLAHPERIGAKRHLGAIFSTQVAADAYQARLDLWLRERADDRVMMAAAPPRLPHAMAPAAKPAVHPTPAKPLTSRLLPKMPIPAHCRRRDEDD